MWESNHMKNGQFVISYRLLALLQWLADNETASIKTIIDKAIKQGLREDLKAMEGLQLEEVAEEAQRSIVDFFDITEKLLDQSIEEERVDQVLTSSLLPTLKQIDAYDCDSNVLAGSVSRTSVQMESNPSGNAQETLYKELLRRWQPDKHKIRN
jgi:hypothetical protein